MKVLQHNLGGKDKNWIGQNYVWISFTYLTVYIVKGSIIVIVPIYLRHSEPCRVYYPSCWAFTGTLLIVNITLVNSRLHSHCILVCWQFWKFKLHKVFMKVAEAVKTKLVASTVVLRSVSLCVKWQTWSLNMCRLTPWKHIFVSEESHWFYETNCLLVLRNKMLFLRILTY